MNLCKCGCGTLVEQNYKRGHGRRGKKNSAYHNYRISLINKGKKMPEAHKERLRAYHLGRKRTEQERKNVSEGCKRNGVGKWMLGRKLSPESIEKGRLKRIGTICSEETKKKIGLANSGENNGMYNKTHTQEAKQKISNRSKEMWKEEEYLKNKKEYYASEIGKMNCRKGALTTFYNIKKYDTKPEKRMAKILKQNNINFLHPYSVFNIKHIYPADFFVPELNLIIEVDGVYWHNYPDGREIDKIRDIELREAGYQVIRFWETEVNQEEVMKKLKNFLENKIIKPIPI